MTAAQITVALGGAHRSSGWWRCRCPVYQRRGATLALREAERALVVHCHAGCEPPGTDFADVLSGRAYAEIRDAAT